MSNVKKISLYIGVTLLLQIGYYLLFMHQGFKAGDIGFNPISIISVLTLVIYYIYLITKGIKLRNIDFSASIRWFILVFVVINSFLVIGSLIGNLFFNIFYFFFTNQAISSYTSPLPTLIWHYNLGQLNLMIIALYIFLAIKNMPTNKEEILVKRLYKITSLIILIALSIGFFTILDLLFYHSFTLMAFLIFWFFIPILYMIIKHFHAHGALLLAWGLSILIYWPLVRALFDNLVHICGYMLP